MQQQTVTITHHEMRWSVTTSCLLRSRVMANGLRLCNAFHLSVSPHQFGFTPSRFCRHWGHIAQSGGSLDPQFYGFHLKSKEIPTFPTSTGWQQCGQTHLTLYWRRDHLSPNIFVRFTDSSRPFALYIDIRRECARITLPPIGYVQQRAAQSTFGRFRFMETSGIDSVFVLVIVVVAFWEAK